MIVLAESRIYYGNDQVISSFAIEKLGWELSSHFGVQDSAHADPPQSFCPSQLGKTLHLLFVL